MTAKFRWMSLMFGLLSSCFACAAAVPFSATNFPGTGVSKAADAKRVAFDAYIKKMPSEILPDEAAQAPTVVTIGYDVPGFCEASERVWEVRIATSNGMLRGVVWVNPRSQTVHFAAGAWEVQVRGAFTATNDLKAVEAEMKSVDQEIYRKRQAWFASDAYRAAMNDGGANINALEAWARAQPKLQPLFAAEAGALTNVTKLKVARQKAVNEWEKQLAEPFARQELARKAMEVASKSPNANERLAGDATFQTARKAYDAAELAIPEIKAISDQLGAAYDARNKAQQALQKMFETDPECRARRNQAMELQDRRRATENAETPEIQRLRARYESLKEIQQRLQREAAGQ